MRSYGWFVFGVVASFFVVLSLGACSFDASGMGDGIAQAEQTDLPTSSGHRTPVDGFVPRPLSLAPMKNGGLTIELVAPKDSTVIGIAGSDVTLATYFIHNDDDVPHTLSRFTVYIGGARAVEDVAYTWDSGVARADVSVPSADDSVTFDVPSGTIAAHSLRQLDITATLRVISPDPSEAPRSGEMVFADVLSAQDEGGEDIALTSLPETKRVILRKSFVEVTPESLMGSLRLGWQDVSSWRVFAHPEGDIALKQFHLNMRLDAATLCSFRLRRNGVLVNAADYRIYGSLPGSSTPIDLKTSCATQEMAVTILFVDEDRVRVGSSSMYALRANVTHLETLSAVRTHFAQRYQLATSSIDCSTDPVASLRSHPSDPPAILWSDLSESPHRFTPCLSSTDWIGDADVTDLSWTLSVE